MQVHICTEDVANMDYQVGLTVADTECICMCVSEITQMTTPRYDGRLTRVIHQARCWIDCCC